MPKDPTQKLNYNCIKRDKIKSEKDISFLFVKDNTASLSVKQSILSVDAGHSDESKDLNDSFGFAVSDELTDTVRSERVIRYITSLSAPIHPFNKSNICRFPLMTSNLSLIHI